jgi:leucyl-tRNA synthetase
LPCNEGIVGIVSVAEGGLDAPGVYEFGDVETRWRGSWDNDRISSESAAAEAPPGTYYVPQSRPHPREDPSLGQLKSSAFADTLTQYHRSRGRRVLTECEECTFDDVQAPDLPEYAKDLQRDMAGGAQGVELIVGCTEVDQARRLTKALARIGLMAMHEPYVRALALGMVTYEREKPISPELCIERYGADTVRCFLLFMGPHEHDLCWSVGQVGGVHRFLSRLWRLAQDVPPQTDAEPLPPPGADLELLRKTHETIHDVTGTMETDRRFHLAIAAIMGLVSGSIRVRDRVQPGTLRFATQSAARLLFPFAPHCAADVYHQLTGERTWEAPWPVADPLFREVVVPGKLVN